MVVEPPDTYLTIPTMRHIFCSILIASITKLSSILLKFLFWDIGRVPYSWIHELCQKIANIDEYEDQYADYSNKSILIIYFFAILSIFNKECENRQKIEHVEYHNTSET